MTKSRRKPTEIEAVRFDGTNARAIADWLNRPFDGLARFRVYELRVPEDVQLRIVYLRIAVLDEVYCAGPGDWVARDEHGDLFVSPPDAFAATYEPAE